MPPTVSFKNAETCPTVSQVVICAKEYLIILSICTLSNWSEDQSNKEIFCQLKIDRSAHPSLYINLNFTQSVGFFYWKRLSEILPFGINNNKSTHFMRLMHISEVQIN